MNKPISKPTYRPISPYSYLNQLNQRATTEQSYPNTNHDKMIQWNLQFQAIKKVAIPKVISDRHELRYRKQTKTGDETHSESKILPYQR